ncbi:MAG: type I-E CRISPR-associated protein Cas7/Cse4/CasC [Bryobacterales bacterium]|nr:type I-E CRISPR-associated protein Cas7/Cse4/CasC [Bryobacterales bacterium]
MIPRFLQFHTLTGYVATLLNRDDVGRAKRLPFGGTDRIRVSSQCLKRHWREATGTWSLQDLGSGKSVRSRRVFSDVIADRLKAQGMEIDQIVNVLTPIRSAVLGESIKARAARTAAKEGDGASALESLRTDQVIVLGTPEIAFLASLAQELFRENPADPAKAVQAYFKQKATRDNLKALGMGAGLDAAIFGRMVTSDLLARTDAAIHVAHSFTVHGEDAEPDYFSALDDLLSAHGELGSGHINTSELTSGLFYGYFAVDLQLLAGNLSGDWQLAAEVVHRLVHLVATVSPGAKLGATAPYACAEVMLAEAGERQPRTVANAFMSAIPKRGVKQKAMAAMGDYLGRYDAMYGRHEERRVATMIEPVTGSHGERVTLDQLAGWASDKARAASS